MKVIGVNCVSYCQNTFDYDAWFAFAWRRSNTIIFLVCCHRIPSSNINSHHSAVPKERGLCINSPTRSARSRFLARSNCNCVNHLLSPANGKNAWRLRSPCFTALVLSTGTPAPARFPPLPDDLDYWLCFLSSFMAAWWLVGGYTFVKIQNGSCSPFRG
ncbi:hypothetical protein KHDHEBDM_02028 [Pectobacterium polaris]|nr:hypothetical protein KHDHEBDM_02028 [Pectobacterium polaris]